MSQRTAVPFFHSIESFARKCEPQIGTKMTFLVMFDGARRKAGNGTVTRFISFVVESLNCQNIITMMKPPLD
eukprot:765109-Hanusia_phi.AAC.1